MCMNKNIHYVTFGVHSGHVTLRICFSLFTTWHVIVDWILIPFVYVTVCI